MDVRGIADPVPQLEDQNVEMIGVTDGLQRIP